MFVVIYRSYVFVEYEAEYKQHWHVVANYFVSCCGALGSSLYKTEEGYWLACSRWPSKEMRDRCWPYENEKPPLDLPEDIQQVILKLKSFVDPESKFDEIHMTLECEVGKS